MVALLIVQQTALSVVVSAAAALRVAELPPAAAAPQVAMLQPLEVEIVALVAAQPSPLEKEWMAPAQVLVEDWAQVLPLAVVAHSNRATGS